MKADHERSTLSTSWRRVGKSLSNFVQGGGKVPRLKRPPKKGTEKAMERVLNKVLRGQGSGDVLRLKKAPDKKTASLEAEMESVLIWKPREVEEERRTERDLYI